MDRRDFVGILAIAGLARAGQELRAQDAPAKDVTRKLAHWIVTSKPDETTPAVRKEAARTLLNWVACAVGGSHHEALDMALSAPGPLQTPASAVHGTARTLWLLDRTAASKIPPQLYPPASA